MRAFVLNLDSRPDRLAASLSQASKLEVLAIRVQAVDAKSLKEELAVANPLVTPGVAACWLSHQRAYECFLETDAPLALILEDDVVVDARLAATLRTLDADPSKCPGILQVGFLSGNLFDRAYTFYRNWRMRTLWALGTFLRNSPMRVLRWHERLRIREVLEAQVLSSGAPRVVPSEFRAGAHAYVISRRAAEALHSVNRPIAFSADALLMGLAPMRGVSIRRLAKSEAGQATLRDSDIGTTRFAGG